MENRIQETTAGIVIFVLGIIATYLAWDMFYAFFLLINSTLLRVIWIIGFIGIWGINIVAIPYLFIIGGSGLKVWNGLKGLLIFIVASFLGYLAYYIVPPIITIFNSIADSGDSTIFGGLEIIGSLFWFALIFFWVFGMIIYPIMTALHGGIKKTE